ncbi:MAG: type II toxin-antitoxin system Phd/YefM family antitoxin [Fidelibacterota bacterium]
MKNAWQLQEAKAKFSKVINEAIQHGPQVITKHGVEKVLLISVEDYRKINKPKQKLSTFFNNSPLNNVDLDITRATDIPREIDL